MGGDHGPHVTVPAALDFARDLMRELENAVCVNLREALTKTASANNDKSPLIFIPILLCS